MSDRVCEIRRAETVRQRDAAVVSSARRGGCSLSAACRSGVGPVALRFCAGGNCETECGQSEKLFHSHRRPGTRRPLTGPRSIKREMTRPTTGQKVQCPPNQLCTAEYQSRVVGRNTKPMMGQRMLSKTPRKQWVKKQSTATTSRGAVRARSVMMHGIDQGSSRMLRIEVCLNALVMPGVPSDEASSPGFVRLVGSR